ncbi:MAG: tRNA (guanosine(46)-N7)-methyltransferase TrmB [Flavobacteriia bacterium]|jgi:tRNA (guanine-N7-)-methyltransferase|nr:tRNA (guanosine(46)-N7)-methyltransferase TrmB [Flavobacteriia bacterium]
MAKDKLARFAAIKTFSNVLEHHYQASFPMKGHWHRDFFKNDHPIVLELGCGKGEYSVGMSRLFPEKNFLGLDIKGNRMFIGARQALKENLNNVGFLRTRIDFVESLFGPDEVDEIWLTFSDPQPQKPKKRLSSSLFINRYRSFLKPGGTIHMKTDNDLLFDFTMEEIELHGYTIIDYRPDLYATLNGAEDSVENTIFRIKTHYETLFHAKGHVIKYVSFKVH